MFLNQCLQSTCKTFIFFTIVKVQYFLTFLCMLYVIMHSQFIYQRLCLVIHLCTVVFCRAFDVLSCILLYYFVNYCVFSYMYVINNTLYTLLEDFVYLKWNSNLDLFWLFVCIVFVQAYFIFYILTFEASTHF